MKYNYIIIEGEKDAKCANFEDVVRTLVNDQYYEMSDQEKKAALARKAAANSLNQIPLANSNTILDFVLDNEVTYVLSLLSQNIVYLLENTKNRELTKDIVIPDDGKNYVIVNYFANMLLENYQKGKKQKTKK